ncbi:hypothetical protein J6590_027756 [Homalodisca vitripennis]|nr:hypothetical protein J6590_027756 [Homalodisca vitripennis]
MTSSIRSDFRTAVVSSGVRKATVSPNTRGEDKFYRHDRNARTLERRMIVCLSTGHVYPRHVVVIVPPTLV